MVKNEEAIIERTLRHLFDQGVDHVLIADNLSTDDTPAILDRLAREFPLHVATDREPAYHQSLKMGLLADAARRSGAEWVIPFDADELWFGSSGTLGTYLRTLESEMVYAAMHNLFPIREGARVGGPGWRLQVNADRRVKMAFRPHRFATISMGNHRVWRPGRIAGELKIIHIPWRSREHFVSKATAGWAALAAGKLWGGHWQVIAELSDGEVARKWSVLLEGKPVAGIEWSPAGPSLDLDVWEWKRWDPDARLGSQK